MGKKEVKPAVYFSVTISKRDAKLISKLPERTRNLLRRKMARQLKEALSVIQEYQDLME